MACRGQKVQGDIGYLIADYFTRLNLGKLGYTFNGDDLENWEVTAYNVIEAEINKFQEQQMKRKGKSRGK